MDLYVVFLNPHRYKSTVKLTQVECHFFTDMTEAAEFAKENGGVEVYTRSHFNDAVRDVKLLSDIYFTTNPDFYEVE